MAPDAAKPKAQPITVALTIVQQPGTDNFDLKFSADRDGAVHTAKATREGLGPAMILAEQMLFNWQRHGKAIMEAGEVRASQS